MLIDDIELMIQDGARTPYLSVDTAWSYLSGSMVMTHKSLPSLSGLCQTQGGCLAVIYVDQLPKGPQGAGIMFRTQRTRPSIKPGSTLKQDLWLIQVQQGSFAWQFMANQDIDFKEKPLQKVLFLQWKPGTFHHALEHHHNLLRAMDKDLFEMGTDLERVGLSTLMLSEGMSCIANTVLNMPWLDNVMSDNEVHAINHPCIVAARTIDAHWVVNAQAVI